MSGDEVKELKLSSIIGFDGKIINGLILHPNGQDSIFSLGNTVIILNLRTGEQHFLFGHTNNISSLALSNSGQYIASGQINFIGFKAKVIIWDLTQKTKLYEHESHKVQVQSIIFSSNDKYVISLGGKDCGSIIVWQMQEKRILCTAQCSRGTQGEATILQRTNLRDETFLSAGDGNLTVWTIDVQEKKIQFQDANTSKLKRFICSLVLNETDEFCYCATTTGDILKIALHFSPNLQELSPVTKPNLLSCMAKIPKKLLARGCVDLYEKGARIIKLLKNGLLIVGGGEGTINLVQIVKGRKFEEAIIKQPAIPAIKVIKSTGVYEMITGITLDQKETFFYVSTLNNEVYYVDLKEFKAKLLKTCHVSAINSIAFPQNFSQIFATASKDDVRLWSVESQKELLRIKIYNVSCTGVVFAFDGRSILTSWTDGVIRSFTPLTGQIIFAIKCAHNKGVSALATTSHGRMLVSGGCEGQVRLWDVSPFEQSLNCTLKEHKGPVSALQVNKTDDGAVSASTDGTCIIWDLKKKCRRQILFANTLFLCVNYDKLGVQVLTGGSNRKLAYWEVFDGSLVREIEGSCDKINTLNISVKGDIFASGGADQIVKLWKYQEGIVSHLGIGHSAEVTSIMFNPDSRYIVTGSSCGSIIIFENPYYFQEDITKEEQKEDKSLINENVLESQRFICENCGEKCLKKKHCSSSPKIVVTCRSASSVSSQSTCQ